MDQDSKDQVSKDSLNHTLILISMHASSPLYHKPLNIEDKIKMVLCEKIVHNIRSNIPYTIVILWAKDCTIVPLCLPFS